MTMPASAGENMGVRTSRALVLTAILAVQPVCVFAASYASKRDPVGEKVYASGQLERMAPIAIMIGGFSIAWLLYKVRRKARKVAPNNAEAHRCWACRLSLFAGIDKSVCCCINRSVKGQPTLESNRLALRPLMVKDAISLRELANSPQIAGTCVWLPHPCSKGLAKCWIRGASARYAAGAGAEFGIQLKGGGELFGVVGFDDRSVNNASAELGFLLDPRCWGKGYATEAADLAVWYGFKHL